MLRGVAALMVCWYHFTNSYYEGSGHLLPDGDILRETGKLGINGVFIFFVISGCVIPLSMLKGGYVIGRLHRFIARRWVRIEIPYIASIFAFLCFYYINCRIHMWNFEFDPMRFLHHLTYTVPFTKYEWYNVIFWTLAIEFQFYLVIALLYPLLVHRSKIVAIAALLVFGLSGLFVTHNSLFFHYGAIFGLGITLFLLKTDRIKLPEAIALLIVFSGVVAYTHDWIIAVFSISTALLIAFVTIDGKWWNKLGDISYSLYLMHGIIGGNLFFLLIRYVDGYWPRVGLLIGVTIVSVLGSWLFWKIIEDPSRKLSKRVKL